MEVFCLGFGDNMLTCVHCMCVGWLPWRCWTASCCWGRPARLSNRPTWRRSSSRPRPPPPPAASPPEHTVPHTHTPPHRKVTHTDPALWNIHTDMLTICVHFPDSPHSSFPIPVASPSFLLLVEFLIFLSTSASSLKLLLPLLPCLLWVRGALFYPSL